MKNIIYFLFLLSIGCQTIDESRITRIEERLTRIENDMIPMEELILKCTETDESLINVIGSMGSTYGEPYDTLVKKGMSAVPALIKALADDNWQIRRGAAICLGRIGAREAVEPLISHLVDKIPAVRPFIATALKRIGDKRAIRPLISSMEGQDPWYRETCARALNTLTVENFGPDYQSWKNWLDDSK